MLIPISQFIPPLSFPPGNHKFVFYICDSISVHYVPLDIPLLLFIILFSTAKLPYGSISYAAKVLAAKMLTAKVHRAPQTP